MWQPEQGHIFALAAAAAAVANQRDVKSALGELGCYGDKDDFCPIFNSYKMSLPIVKRWVWAI